MEKIWGRRNTFWRNQSKIDTRSMKYSCREYSHLQLGFQLQRARVFDKLAISEIGASAGEWQISSKSPAAVLRICYFWFFFSFCLFLLFCLCLIGTRLCVPAHPPPTPPWLEWLPYFKEKCDSKIIGFVDYTVTQIYKIKIIYYTNNKYNTI